MYYHTNGVNYSGSHGSSGSAYTSPFVKPSPNRWYIPISTKEPAKSKNTWLSTNKTGAKI